jgi:transposase
MDQKPLFDVGPRREREPGELPPRVGPRRLRCAVRNQVEFQECSLNELLSEDHEARIVWEYVSGLDLSELRDRIQAVEGGPGQAPADPRILLTLWLYATLRGVGSARELDRLCANHTVYRWICGGVSMNYHTLSDFRTAHVELLDRLLTAGVAGLMAEGLVSLDRVAQDGMKVRASAGAASFRRQATLEEALAEAEEQVAQLKKELEADPGASKTRQQAARQRAAEERAARVRAALEQLPNTPKGKKPQDREQARASTTDADARVMKMGDGGFRPAFNVQLATATDSQIITGVEVTNSGSDQGQLSPMIEQHQARYEQVPDAALVDGGFAKKEDIEKVEQGGTTVYAPVQKPKDPQRDPHMPRDDDSAEVAAWRQRMGTDEAKAIYRERAATAECVNALARNRGLQQFLVRGLRKVKAIALLYALVHNVMRSAALRAAAALRAQAAPRVVFNR